MVMALFKASGLSVGGTEKVHDSRYPGRDLTREPPRTKLNSNPLYRDNQLHIHKSTEPDTFEF